MTWTVLQYCVGYWMVTGLVVNALETVWYKYRNPEYRPKTVWHGITMLGPWLLTVPLWPFTIVSMLSDDDY